MEFQTEVKFQGKYINTYIPSFWRYNTLPYKYCVSISWLFFSEKDVLIINVPIRSTLIKAKYSKQWPQLPSQQAQQMRRPGKRPSIRFRSAPCISGHGDTGSCGLPPGRFSHGSEEGTKKKTASKSNPWQRGRKSNVQLKIAVPRVISPL